MAGKGIKKVAYIAGEHPLAAQVTAQFKKPIHVVLPAVYGLLNFKNILIPRGDSQVQLRELSPYPIQHAFGGRIGCGR